MTKARRMMEESIRLVDLVIEILDARVPDSSRNPDIDRLARGKERLLILAKADLADPNRTQLVIRQQEAAGMAALALDARSDKSNPEIRRAIQEATHKKRERDARRGLVNRPVRAMVCGIPNVGKSTFINSLSGRKRTRTGNKPGVTRGKQWISLGGIDLLDTPGLLWPKFEDRQVGVNLALVGSIREEILDEEELALELLAILLSDYPQLLVRRYAIAIPAEGRAGDAAQQKVSAIHDEMSYTVMERYEILRQIALCRGLVRSGGEPDQKRAAALLLDEFRSGRIGRITIDRAGDCADPPFIEQDDSFGV